MLADKKKEIYDADIGALIEQQIHTIAEKWTLDSYKVTCGTGQVPEVTLWLHRGDEKCTTSSMACGDGPIDAVFLAIEQVTVTRSSAGTSASIASRSARTPKAR